MTPQFLSTNGQYKQNIHKKMTFHASPMIDNIDDDLYIFIAGTGEEGAQSDETEPRMHMREE